MTSQVQQIDLNALTSQVANLLHLLNAFSDSLDQEAAAIKSNQSENLISSSHAKQTIADQLKATGTDLDKVIQPVSDNLIDLSLSSTFQKFPKTLQDKIKSTINLTVECHDKNLANGMSIQILSNLNQQALEMLSGKPKKDVQLYGASGTQNQSKDQNSLGKA